MQEKCRAALHAKRAVEKRECEKKCTSGELGPDLADAPAAKHGCPAKDDALVRRLAKSAGVRPEIILLTDRVEYVDEVEEEDQDEDIDEDRDEDEDKDF